MHSPSGFLWRVYRAGGRNASSWRAFRSFGPIANCRFDHHPPPPGDHPGYAVLYAALDAKTAVAEAFAERRTVHTSAERPYIAAFRCTSDLRLLDLGSDWPTRAGGSQLISSGPRASARAWSRAIHEEFADLDGLAYPSSMSGHSSNIALYQRAEPAFPSSPEANLPLDHPALRADLIRWADELGYAFV